MGVSYETKKKLSLLSGLMIHSQFGAMYTLGTITPYIASYIKYHGDPDIQVVDVAINYPFMMVSITVALILSTHVFQNYVSPKILCFMGTWMYALGVFIASFMTNLWSFVLFFSVFCSLGTGTTYLTPIKNCYLYYPNKKGMCAGVCMMGYGVGSFIFNQIFRYIVNPDNLPADKDHFFPPSVAHNFPTALRYLSLVYFMIGTIGCLCFFDQRQQFDIFASLPSLENKTSLISSQQFIKTVSSSQSLQGERSSVVPLKKSSSLKKSSWKILKNYLIENPSKRNQFIKIAIIIITSAVYGVFMAYNYKQYGQSIINDDRLITILGSLGCIGNSAGRIFWSAAFDYLSFRRIMTILNSCLFMCCLLCIFIENKYMYMVIVVLAYFFSGSFYGIIPTQVFRIGGDQIGALVYPFIYGGFATASISQFLFHELGIRKWGNEGFKIAFVVFGCFQFASIFAVYLFKFTYTDSQTKKNFLNDEKQQNSPNITYTSSTINALSD